MGLNSLYVNPLQLEQQLKLLPVVINVPPGTIALPLSRRAEGELMAISQRLRPAEAALYLGFSQSTLAKMRLRGDGPPYAKLGKRIVIYDSGDLEKWIANRKRSSTSEQAHKSFTP